VLLRGERLAEDVAAELTVAGIDGEKAIEQGALTLLTSRSRQYMPLEKFDASALIALFRTRAQQALNAGFYCASFVVEMTWTGGTKSSA
jgi:MEDS: MEthanogen/methylotroph, DcmR Sensory domain